MKTKWHKSTCPYCGIGCGLSLAVNQGRILEIRGLKNHPANYGRICNIASNLKSVFTAEGRLTKPLIRKKGKLEPVSWEKVVEFTAAELRKIIKEHGPGAIAFYGGAANLNEEYYLINKLMKGGIGTNNIECSTRLCMASSAMGFFSTFGADAPPASYSDIEEADLFFIAGCNMAVSIPIIYNRVRDAKDRGAKIIVVDPRKTETAGIADIHLQIKPGTDVALNNSLAHVLIKNKYVDMDRSDVYLSGLDDFIEFIEEYPPSLGAEITGCTESQIIEAAHTIGQAKSMLSFWFQGYNHSTQAVFKNNTLHNISLITDNYCRPGAGPMSITGEANALGNRWIGALSHLLPGMRQVSNFGHRKYISDFWGMPIEKIQSTPGRSILDIIKGLHSGEIRALWITATNPAASLPHTRWIEEGLKKAGLLIVQDIFHPTETTQLADIVLPAAQWSEKTGTFISSDRRIQLVEKFVDPPGEAKPDYEIIWLIAQAMGFKKEFPYSSPKEVFEELKQTTIGRLCDMGGISYQRLRNNFGLQLPCPGPDHPGTERLFTDLHFPRADGRAALLARDYIEPAEISDKQYPFILITGRSKTHFNTRTRTGRIESLNKLQPDNIVEIFSGDAGRLGIKENDEVEVFSRRGVVYGTAKIKDSILPGTVYMNCHYGRELNVGEGRLANLVSNPVYDLHSKQPEFKISAVSIILKEQGC